MSNYRTAIIYCTQDQVNGKRFLKYRNIKDDQHSLDKFKRFARKFPGAWYVNWYDKITKTYIGIIS